jgi:hypothetical protein
MSRDVKFKDSMSWQPFSSEGIMLMKSSPDTNTRVKTNNHFLHATEGLLTDFLKLI